MSAILDYLRRFNSKERFFLVGQILGNPDFKPSEDFRKKLGDQLQLDIPEKVFSAMDYHLDWLYAALQNAKSPKDVYRNDDKMIKAQQEDMDFLIAYDSADTCHIILIEAKGVTGWTNKQMTSKAERLTAIFGEGGKKWPEVKPHFVLMSKSEPVKLETNNWPRWMMRQDNKVAHIELIIPNDLLGVSRCDEDGNERKDGQSWKTSPRT
jgi:hypothetical protein